jgi:chaperonin GroEL (HSP60 family)
VLNEIERNLQDAMQVVRNVHFDPRMLPGGGATELAVSTAITKSLDTVEGACSVRVVVAVILCCAVLLAVVTAMELLNASLN